LLLDESLSKNVREAVFSLIGVRLFEMLNQAVAQRDCVSERLHGNGSFLETGDVVKIRDATECEHDVIVFQRMSLPVEPVSDDDTSMRM
jgi:hypothetical protein